MSLAPRLKIWDHTDYACPIVGTCLSMAELRKLLRKLEVSISPAASDFERHVAVIQLVKRPGHPARTIQKFLDRKYAPAIRRFARVTNSQELEALWVQVRTEGDIPGPFWALLTHPCATHALRERVFGEVHMLSHLVGAANRADIRRLASLEQQLENSRMALRLTGERHRRQRQDAKAQLEELRQTLREERQARADLRLETEALRAAMAETEHAAVEAEELPQLRQALDEQARMLDSLRREVRRAEERQQQLSRENDRLRARLVAAGLCPGEACSGQVGEPCPMDPRESCPGAGLCGKKVLYVGGRNSLVQHYRLLVEAHGGQFSHHDGGIEASAESLAGLLAQADVVLCPVNCVSHGACLRAKRHCRADDRAFIPLRSASLSTLVRTLAELEDVAALPAEVRQ